MVGTGLGALSGNWIFFTRLVPLEVHGRLEVWGMPVGGTPRLAFSYTAPIAGVGPLDSSPYLRRQFSPDGRKIVVTTLAGLVIVDLATASSTLLGVGQFPSWSKDGATIAYLATVSRPDPQFVPPENAIWIVPAAGGAVRQLANVGYSSTAPEWSPDSTLLIAQLKSGVGLIDVATGRELADGRIPFAPFTTGAHWRNSGPAIVTILRSNDTQLVHFDVLNRRFGFLAQWPRPVDASEGGRPKGMVPRDPRWNPTGNDEVVFALLDESANRTDAMILDLQSGPATKAISNIREVTWSSDGRQLVYIGHSSSGGGAVRVWDRASGTDRELVGIPAGAPAGTAQLSVASVAY